MMDPDREATDQDGQGRSRRDRAQGAGRAVRSGPVPGAGRRAQGPGRAAPDPSLTLEGGDERLPVLDELLDELVGLLQLGLVGAEPLPELGAVQAALAELQRRQPHAARTAHRPPKKIRKKLRI